MSWSPLHMHSSIGSLLDGVNSPSEIATECHKQGFTSAAITDHGTITAHPEFYKACKEHGIKAILGCEFYVCPNIAVKDRNLTHLVVLAKNLEGWYELVAAVSKSNTAENFYYKPRLDFTDIKTFLGNGNHICINGHAGTDLANCLFTSNEVYRSKTLEEARTYLSTDWKEQAQSIIAKYVSIFGDNFYTEIQLIDQENLPAAKLIGECLRSVAVRPVATSDSHYTTRDNAHLQRVLLCSSLNRTLKGVYNDIAEGKDVPLQGFFVSDNYHIPSLEEMQKLHTEEELINSLAIAEKCEDYDITRQPQLPKYDCPDGMTEFEYLTQLCRNGWRDKLQQAGKVSNEESKAIYLERIKEELTVIEEANLSGYFLIVWDIVNFCKQNNWLTGVGRGCFLPDSLVKMANGGYKPIAMIKEGEAVIDAYGQSNKVYDTFTYSVDEELVELEFENGKIIRCTKDHKILTTNRGWVEAINLNESDDIKEV